MAESCSYRYGLNVDNVSSFNAPRSLDLFFFKSLQNAPEMICVGQVRQ
jgi:hypothetical protein